MRDPVVATKTTTVGELIEALQNLPADAPIATLYDWGAGLDYGVTVHGMHVCDTDCNEYHCSLFDHAVLDINPRPV